MTLHLVFMGVSGTGKTAVGRAVSERLGLEFLEGDDLHPAGNVAAMAHGTPLTDDDRWPWLRAIADWTRSQLAAGRSTGVTCSALRRSYRGLLRDAAPTTTFVHLAGPPDLILERMRKREHFMAASMLGSQLETLEPPADEEQVVRVDISAPLDEIVADLVRRFGGPDA